MAATNDNGWLRGRGVIMTAAAAGIGRVVADAFVREGARVHLCDVDAAALEDAASSSPLVTATRVDLADPAEIDHWLSVTIDALGVVDVLVNNAGTKGPTAFVEDVTDSDWRHCLAVSLDSHFQCSRRVAPVMKVQGHGSIIEISSTAGQFGYGMRTPYAAAKWAVIGLAKSLAVELGPHGVRCNAVCPGSVAGPRMQAVIAAEAGRRGIPPEQVEHEYLAGQSIKRFIEPSEIADLCLFLASPASRMISGQAIAIDGHTEAFHL